jgi:hypothetical protein
MGGIADYFHGEQGQVSTVNWLASDEYLAYTISLRGDPHRIMAQDYSSDIGIDPIIKPGDDVIYVRPSSTSGMWVKKGQQYTPELQAALSRVQVNRRRCLTYLDLLSWNRRLAQFWARAIAYRTGVVLKISRGDENLFDRGSLPRTDASIFLSHSGRNSLAARLLYEKLRGDGKAEVWCDLAQTGESQTHEQRISDWLRTALYDCQIFVVLLTRASIESEWVRKEIAWAIEKSSVDESFHLVLLNLEGVTVPRLASKMLSVIDCEGLQFGEIEEELYAAVYQRMGRRAWVEEQHRRGWHEREPRMRGYEHLMSDGGTATALHWIEEGDSFRWVLEFEVDGIEKRVAGRGPWQVVDVDICPGESVGCIALGLWNPLCMRSRNLNLSYGDVIAKYQEKVGAPDKWFLTHSLETKK